MDDQRSDEWMREARRAVGMALFRAAAEGGLTTPTDDERKYFMWVLAMDPDHQVRARRRIMEMAVDSIEADRRRLASRLDRRLATIGLPAHTYESLAEEVGIALRRRS